jgi:3-oxoacyl-[acyl-carrier protein] reductase
MGLKGRVALVTGAGGQGMGRSIALTLGREGAAVVVNYRRSAAAAAEVVSAVEAMGSRAFAHAADVTDPAAIDAMVAETERVLGCVDIVVNSAGAPWKPQDITEIESAHLREVLALEVESSYYLLKAALPRMRDQGWGRFISIGGHMADDWRFGPPDAPLDYPLGKAARHWLTRTLAPREIQHGVTFNAVAAGPTARFTAAEALAAVRGELPRRNENTPQDIAEVIAFLCSDAAARVTGAVIPVPGAKPV